MGRISLAEVSLIEDPSDDERIDEGESVWPQCDLSVTPLISSLFRVLALLEPEQRQQPERPEQW